eukprot:475904_1
MSTTDLFSRFYRNKSLVHGYIRMFQNIYGCKLIIPSDIITICFNFYFIQLDSLILTDDQTLNDFHHLLSSKISLQRFDEAKLLFRASRDDGKAKTMFEKLTNNGPYLFVIKSTDNYLFGGYFTQNIDATNSSKYISDATAFLYVLNGAPLQKPEIYSIKSPIGDSAIYYNGFGYWFIFGPSGADILLYPTFFTATHYCCMNRGSNLLYETPTKQTLVGTNQMYKFMLSEMEIYHIPYEEK